MNVSWIRSFGIMVLNLIYLNKFVMIQVKFKKPKKKVRKVRKRELLKVKHFNVIYLKLTLWQNNFRFQNMMNIKLLFFTHWNPFLTLIMSLYNNSDCGNLTLYQPWTPRRVLQNTKQKNPKKEKIYNFHIQ